MKHLAFSSLLPLFSLSLFQWQIKKKKKSWNHRKTFTKKEETKCFISERQNEQDILVFLASSCSTFLFPQQKGETYWKDAGKKKKESWIAETLAPHALEKLPKLIDTWRLYISTGTVLVVEIFKKRFKNK